MFEREKAFIEKIIRKLIDPLSPYRVRVAKIGLVVVLLIPLLAALGIGSGPLITLWVWIGPFAALIFILILFFDYLRRQDPKRMDQLNQETLERQQREEHQRQITSEAWKREKARKKAQRREENSQYRKGLLRSVMFWKK